MSDSEPDLRERSIRTLAWIGDAEFERELRIRLARRGDYPLDRLDGARAMISRAEAQARLLATIEEQLDPGELAVIQRARNASLKAGARSQRDTKAYRAATALEALVAHWMLGDDRHRFDELLVPEIEAAIDEAIARSRRPRRG